jgi:predicted TIM-barrel fold metal-dependent hydrolase
MDRLAGEGGIIGFRLSEIGGPRDPTAPMDARTFRSYPIWAHAARRDYVIWLYARAGDAHQIPFLLDAFPNLRVVFNHLMVCPGKGKFHRDAKGRPRIDTPIPPETRYNTMGLYQYENVCVKLSGQYAFSKEPYPYKDLAAWHDRLVKTFGADHCMWATDFPFVREDPGYANQAKVLDELLPNLTPEERKMVMGGAAERRLWRERG